MWILAGLAAAGGGLAAGSPTGVGAEDVVLRAGMCAFCVLIGSSARRWDWVAASVVTVVGSYNEVWLVLALVALGLGLVGLWVPRRMPETVVGAFIGACVSQVMLRLSLSPVFGISAALAGLAVLILVLAGVGHARRAAYPWLGWAALGLGTLVVVAGLGGVVATLRARPTAALGLTEAEAGAAAVQANHSTAELDDLLASALASARHPHQPRPRLG